MIERRAGLHQGVRDRDSSEIAQLLRSHFLDHTIQGNGMNLIALIGGEEVKGSGDALQGLRLPGICFWGGVLEGVVEKIGEGRGVAPFRAAERGLEGSYFAGAT